MEMWGLKSPLCFCTSFGTSALLRHKKNQPTEKLSATQEMTHSYGLRRAVIFLEVSKEFY